MQFFGDRMTHLVRLIEVLGLGLLAYGGGYGLARWSHVLVRISYFSTMKEGRVVSHIAPFVQREETTAETMMAATAGPAAFVFLPLRSAEEWYWMRVENSDRDRADNNAVPREATLTSAAIPDEED